MSKPTNMSYTEQVRYYPMTIDNNDLEYMAECADQYSIQISNCEIAIQAAYNLLKQAQDEDARTIKYCLALFV